MSGMATAAVACAAAAAAASNAAAAELHLLADPDAVARSERATISFGPVVKHPDNPFLTEDQPFDVAWLNTYPTAAWDPVERKYKMWWDGALDCGVIATGREGMCPRAGYPSEWVSDVAGKAHPSRSATYYAESPVLPCPPAPPHTYTHSPGRPRPRPLLGQFPDPLLGPGRDQVAQTEPRAGAVQRQHGQ